MKIKIQRTVDLNDCKRQRLFVETQTFNDGISVNPLWETPEDAIIDRDLVSCDDILTFMEAAYNAGLRHEEWNFTNESVDYEDWW